MTYLSRAKLIGNYSNGSFFYRESKIGHVHAIRSYGKWSTSTPPLPQGQFHFSKLFSSILQSVPLGKKHAFLTESSLRSWPPPPSPILPKKDLFTQMCRAQIFGFLIFRGPFFFFFHVLYTWEILLLEVWAVGGGQTKV